MFHWDGKWEPEIRPTWGEQGNLKRVVLKTKKKKLPRGCRKGSGSKVEECVGGLKTGGGWKKRTRTFPLWAEGGDPSMKSSSYIHFPGTDGEDPGGTQNKGDPGIITRKSPHMAAS